MSILGKIASSWLRMGIYSRLFTPIFIIIVCISSLRYSALITSETADESARYRAQAGQLEHYLATTLAPLSGERDRANAEALLAGALRLNGDLAAIRWERPGQRIALRSADSGLAAYPDWFQRLVDIKAIERHVRVAQRDGGAGQLALLYSPTLPINRIWDKVIQQTSVSGTNLLILLALYIVLTLILSANRKMLERLALASDRFQRGDHGVRIPVTGTREGRALANTFNNMAGEVQTLVLSLRTSQQKLGEQLAQTLRMRNALQQVSWQNHHDSLTGLPNQSALATHFEQELLLTKGRPGLLAVCLIDLDYFQSLNERLGAAVGDTLLQQVANRLQAFAGERHYAARLGGDEFLLLLREQTDSASIECAVADLLGTLAAPYHSEAQPLAMSASAGVAIYGGGDTSRDTLMRHAEQALYQAKLSGRNKMQFFDSGLDDEARAQHQQRAEIGQALQDGQLRLYYQPKVNLRGGEVVGMEALLRWQHPERGIVGPLHFLPLVEHTDLIIDIGEWVLRDALRQMALWNDAGRPWVVSVNIAARHFQRPDFVARLSAILAEFPDVPASLLELEILESSALHDVEHVHGVMTACQKLGVTFALDDFGTGYSSLSHLKRLPADTLKIDQSFVRSMLDDEDDLHLVGAVIGLARSFHLAVIAEGVETAAHGAQLLRMGCELAQGYGIARPMPADAVLQWAAGFVPDPDWLRRPELVQLA